MAITPESILPDAQNSALINGVNVRKGSVAAVLANINVYESPLSSEADKQSALDVIKGLAPALKAIGLTQHLRFNNSEIQALIDHAA